jgi:hypothetical protein
MLMNKKAGTLLLAGLAAFAYYKYSKMSREEKDNLANSIKDQGKKLYDRFAPKNMRNSFADATNNRFGDGSEYSA